MDSKRHIVSLIIMMVVVVAVVVVVAAAAAVVVVVAVVAVVVIVSHGKVACHSSFSFVWCRLVCRGLWYVLFRMYVYCVLCVMSCVSAIIVS